MTPTEYFLASGINTVVNDLLTYTRDDDRDIWQSAAETISLGTGDCDDYAILKMWMLKDLIRSLDVRVAFVFTSEGEAHMICMIGDFVLDNNFDNISTLEDQDYTLIFTLDDKGRLYDDLGKLSKSRVDKFDALLEK